SMSGASLLTAFWAPPDAKKSESAKMADYEQTRATAAEDKSQKLAFEAAVRIIYRGNLPEQQAKLRMQSIIASYRQFNTTYLNGFTAKRVAVDPYVEALYRARQFGKQGFTCNIEEVATLYHLPHTNVETPYILWAASQTAEPPANLPLVTSEHRDDISPLASTNFRGHNTMFGMPRADRSRHLYIIGQTGVGKSGLLELLTISDIYSPYGFALIDPHGDYAQNILKRIPAERAKDVIYFNPADTDFPIAFNPMEVPDPKLKSHTTSELIGVLKRMFESWGPRLEYILRYCLLALLDYPESTMLDITRILTDKKFRAEVLKHVEDPVVRNFWTVEFASWNERFAAEAIAPVLNKVGAFTANPLVRNIIGQPKSSFNIRQIMNERKILIVNLSRGLVGEDNASLLGALLVTKIQLAAMSRADIPADQRAPFYLYVDEFQNFATDSFATILSEARKYGLNLTVANQYIAQMPLEVRDAVFGNVGSIIAFRMSADDSTKMLRYFQPKFEESDLVHMHNRYFVVSMTIDGEKVQGFSAISLNLPDSAEDHSAAIIAHSRAQYSMSKERVEFYVGQRYHDEQSKARAAAKLPPLTVQAQKSKADEALKLPAFSPPKNSIQIAKPSSAQSTARLAQTVVGSVISVAAEKTKRKRTRRRKKSSPVADLPVSQLLPATVKAPAIQKSYPLVQKSSSDLQELTSGHSVKIK
ncbi:MAG: type IV secretory system conjugative DNA transfer family protein, partial [Candidatus Saccharimonadales bacterium]